MKGNNSLREIHFPESLDTSEDDLVCELYVPALRRAKRYDRGVGYFTSGWLAQVSEGLVDFVEHGGKMRLITSPHLSWEDWDAINQGHNAQSNPTLLQSLNAAIDDLTATTKSHPVDVLAWMIADNILDLRIAIPTNKLSGDFHSKIGVFEDAYGDFMAFSGSLNETAKGFQNFETLQIHLGWTRDRDARHAQSILERFERIWDQNDTNVRCFKLPEAIKIRLVCLAQKNKRPYKLKGKSEKPPPINKWRHQDEAIAAFMEKPAGVLAMATGTGKTRIAIRIDSCLRKKDRITHTIVATFGTDLLDQWRREIISHNAGGSALYCAYGNYHEAEEFCNAQHPSCLLINRRNLADIMQRLVDNKERCKKTLIVCDEVHGFGEPSIVDSLHGNLSKIGFRLGLSATPDREYDEEGNFFIEQEIGPVIFSFSIEEAISRGILCELDYDALEFQYSDEDRFKIKKAWARYSARSREGKTDKTNLYIDLAKIKKLSKEKIPLFENYVRNRPEILNRCIIFVEEAEYGHILQELLVSMRVEFHTYYGDDDRENLQRFTNKKLDCLITCKRISEGIDIKSVNNVVLFATAKAPIETVQRVGRCLRIDPSNPSKRAKVIDFIKIDESGGITPTNSGQLQTDEQRRSWFEKLASVKREGDVSND